MRTLTFGYRFEGLLLHDWAARLTKHLGMVVPHNKNVSDIVWHSHTAIFQDKTNDLGLIEAVRQLNPDIILCCCYPFRLVKEILEIPRLGCINIHPGKLPENRGKDPIGSVMAKGSGEHAVTLHYMDEGFDTGDIIASREISFGNWVSKSYIQVSLAKAGIELLELYWPQICAGTAPRRKQ